MNNFNQPKKNKVTTVEGRICNNLSYAGVCITQKSLKVAPIAAMSNVPH